MTPRRPSGPAARASRRVTRDRSSPRRYRCAPYLWLFDTKARDITVYQSDRHPNSPVREYYLQAAERLGGNRACLALARKLLKRCYHTLHELGEDALAPPFDEPSCCRSA